MANTDFIKSLFGEDGNTALTYDQFTEALGKSSIKLANLAEGQYVAKNKYEDDIAKRDTTISALNDTIAQRDSDLASIKTQLESAGVDQTKLTQLTTDLGNLQGKYDADTQALQAKLDRQAYEFAVKDFAGTKKFTSKGAKSAFIQTMLGKELKMEKDTILGAEDFYTAYRADNEDSFVEDKPADPPPADRKPMFIPPMGGNPNPVDGGKNTFSFNFTGVRPRE